MNVIEMQMSLALVIGLLLIKALFTLANISNTLADIKQILRHEAHKDQDGYEDPNYEMCQSYDCGLEQMVKVKHE